MSSPQTVTTNSLSVDYEVTATGGDDPEVYLVADTVDHGKDLYKWKFRLALGKIGLGSGVAILDGLNADAVYFVRMYAVNSAGEDWTGKESEIRYQPLKNHLPMALSVWFDATDPLADETKAIEGAFLSTWRHKSGFERDMDNSRVIQPSKWMDTRDSLWLTLTVMINFGRLIPSMQTKLSEIWDMLLLEYQDILAGIMRDSFHPWDGTGQWVTLGIKSQVTI